MLSTLYTERLRERDLSEAEVLRIFAYAMSKRDAFLITRCLYSTALFPDARERLLQQLRDSGEEPLVRIWTRETRLKGPALEWLQQRDEETICLVLSCFDNCERPTAETLRALWKTKSRAVRFALLPHVRWPHPVPVAWGRWLLSNYKHHGDPKAYFRSLGAAVPKWALEACHDRVELASWVVSGIPARNLDSAVMSAAQNVIRRFIDNPNRPAEEERYAVWIVLQLAHCASDSPSQTREVREFALSLLAMLSPGAQSAADMRALLDIREDKEPPKNKAALLVALAEGGLSSALVREVATRAAPSEALWQALLTHPELTPEHVVELARALPEGEMLYDDSAMLLALGRDDGWLATVIEALIGDRKVDSVCTDALLRAMSDQPRLELLVKLGDGDAELRKHFVSKRLGGVEFLAATPVADLASLDGGGVFGVLLAYARARLAEDERTWDLFEKLADDFTGTFAELVATAQALAA